MCASNAECNGARCDDGNTDTANDVCDSSGTCAGTAADRARDRKLSDFYPSCTDLYRATASWTASQSAVGVEDKGVAFCATSSATAGSVSITAATGGIADTGLTTATIACGTALSCPTAVQWRAKATLPTGHCWPVDYSVDRDGTGFYQCPVKQLLNSASHCCEQCYNHANAPNVCKAGDSSISLRLCLLRLSLYVVCVFLSPPRPPSTSKSRMQYQCHFEKAALLPSLSADMRSIFMVLLPRSLGQRQLPWSIL